MFRYVLHIFLLIPAALAANASGAGEQPVKDALSAEHCGTIARRAVAGANLTEDAIRGICVSMLARADSRCAFFAEAMAPVAAMAEFEVGNFCAALGDAKFCSETMNRLLASNAIGDLAFGECMRAPESKGEDYCKHFQGMIAEGVNEEDLDTLRTCYILQVSGSEGLAEGPSRAGSPAEASPLGPIVRGPAQDLQKAGTGQAVTATTTTPPRILQSGIVLKPKPLDNFGDGRGFVNVSRLETIITKPVPVAAPSSSSPPSPPQPPKAVPAPPGSPAAPVELAAKPAASAQVNAVVPVLPAAPAVSVARPAVSVQALPTSPVPPVAPAELAANPVVSAQATAISPVPSATPVAKPVAPSQAGASSPMPSVAPAELAAKPVASAQVVAVSPPPAAAQADLVAKPVVSPEAAAAMPLAPWEQIRVQPGQAVQQPLPQQLERPAPQAAAVANRQPTPPEQKHQTETTHAQQGRQERAPQTQLDAQQRFDTQPDQQAQASQQWQQQPQVLPQQLQQEHLPSQQLQQQGQQQQQPPQQQGPQQQQPPQQQGPQQQQPPQQQGSQQQFAQQQQQTQQQQTQQQQPAQQVQQQFQRTPAPQQLQQALAPQQLRQQPAVQSLPPPKQQALSGSPMVAETQPPFSNVSSFSNRSQMRRGQPVQQLQSQRQQEHGQQQQQQQPVQAQPPAASKVPASTQPAAEGSAVPTASEADPKQQLLRGALAPVAAAAVPTVAPATPSPSSSISAWSFLPASLANALPRLTGLAAIATTAKKGRAGSRPAVANGTAVAQAVATQAQAPAPPRPGEVPVAAHAAWAKAAGRKEPASAAVTSATVVHAPARVAAAGVATHPEPPFAGSATHTAPPAGKGPISGGAARKVAGLAQGALSVGHRQEKANSKREEYNGFLSKFVN